MHGKKPCGAGLRPTRTIWLGEASSGRTEISPFKMDTKDLFMACWLADLLETSLWSALSHIPSGENPHMPPKFRPEEQSCLLALKLWHLHWSPREAVSTFTIRLTVERTQRLRQTSHWRTLTPEAVRTLNKLPKSVITSQRNQPITGGLPQWHHTTTIPGGFHRPRGNTRSAVKLNWKQVNQTNLYCCWKLVNWSVCSKDSEVSACDLPQLKLRDSKRVLALNFLQTDLCVHMYVYFNFYKWIM